MSEEKDKIRVAAVVSGDRLRRLRQVQSIQGFSTDTETVQYIISRGLEACSATIRTWEMIKQTQDQTALLQSDIFESLMNQKED